MATGNIQHKSKNCNVCKTQRKFERNGAVWGMGDLILICATSGAYLILRILVNRVRNPWRCKDCGST